MKNRLQEQQAFFESGATRTYQFRKQQLTLLKKAIIRYEKEIHKALFDDLKKNPEESWITETGFLIAEINYALQNLKKWMKPEKAGTNLLNFPSKSFVYKEPLGTVLVIGPWNYPIQLLLVPLVGAMAAGNCMVLKPSEFAPATSSVIKKIIEENFSPDYIMLIEGEGSRIIPEMIREFRFAHIFYTGNSHVGRLIYQMAAEKLIPVTLELGGKSPCVVEDDAKISVTARRIILPKFSNAGQMCVAPDYVLVHASIKDRLVEEMKKLLHEFYTSDPSTSYEYGRIVNEKQFYRLLYYLQHGRIIYGGGHDLATLHIEPTLMEDVPLQASVMGEEIFGPILPIISYNSFEEAKEIIKRNPDPLAFYLFTSSKQKEKLWLDNVSFGGGCINNASWHLTNFHLPFGGIGNSGFGAYHGRYSFDLFSHKKAIMKTPVWFDPSIKYPPYKGKLSLFKKLSR